MLPDVWGLVPAAEVGEVDCAVINTAGCLSLDAVVRGDADLAGLAESVFGAPLEREPALAALKSGWAEFRKTDAFRRPEPDESATIPALVGPEPMAAYLRRSR